MNNDYDQNQEPDEILLGESLDQQIQVVDFPFVPNKAQAELIKNFKQFNIFECHRRLGKTYVALIILLMSALNNPHPLPKYALISPKEKQGERNVADILIELASKIPNTMYYRAKKTLVLPNKATIYILGMQNSDTFKGSFWDGIVMDEFAILDNAEHAWNDSIIPSITKWENKERKGWILITTTPPQERHYYTELYRMALQRPDTWNVVSYNIEQSGVFTPQEIEDLKSTMTPTAFAINYMCSHTVPSEGAFLMESLMMAEQQKRIDPKHCYDPQYPVSVSIDCGIDGVAMWFAQVKDNKIYCIDFYQELQTDKKISYFINLLKSKPYIYNRIYLPFDTAKNYLNADASILTHFQNAFKGTVFALRRESFESSIGRVKENFFRVYVDPRSCKEGIQCLREFKTKIDKKTNRITATLDHNWASHGGDAFRYLIYGITEFKPPKNLYERDRDERTPISMDIPPF